MILAHTLAIDHVLHEASDIELMSDIVEKPLLKIREVAKSSCLFNLMRDNRLLFTLIEHILCAKLILRQLNHVVSHLTKSGVFTEHDAEHLLKRVIEPTQHALSTYFPPREQLIAADPSLVNFCSKS